MARVMAPVERHRQLMRPLLEDMTVRVGSVAWKFDCSKFTFLASVGQIGS